ncbi:MAG TPA: curli-like amyloid fiber formation chaperone CsgH [Pseudomonas sp.]|uniref:curli-like amyloid fiber formation chaperone CsgH n=1 Tax=Pseudomonas sp. TaxID=306 RepID=UPI002B48961C|nr:curli-like amyloid fiber formation chaperone CsgH [Pseudomonas sp.]HKS12103.1 curli-like amyloid fiber formation chaperone CsgH [Pseudomonas sp.]
MDYSQLAVAIDTEYRDTAVLIRPRIDNPVPVTLGYRLSIRQTMGGNTSQINQQGELHTGEASSSVRLSLPENGTCRVHLEVFEEDTLITSVERDCARD